MSTANQLASYAAGLPELYRDILAAYPAVEPGRHARYGLAFQTLAMHFINTGKRWSFGDVQAACDQLAGRGIVEIKHGLFAHPTDLGERLIALLTHKPAAPPANLPFLPPPPPPGSW